MDENRTEREEENERRLHERIRQNAQRDFSQLGFPADPLKIVGNSARPESEAQQKPENGKREREKQNPENGAQK